MPGGMPSSGHALSHFEKPWEEAIPLCPHFTDEDTESSWAKGPAQK